MGFGDIISGVKDTVVHVGKNVLGAYDAAKDLVWEHKLLSVLVLAGVIAGGGAICGLALFMGLVALALAPAAGAIAGDLLALALAWLKGERPSWETLDKAARVGGVTTFASVAALLGISGALLAWAPAAPAVVTDVGAYLATGAAIQSELERQGREGAEENRIRKIALWPINTILELAKKDAPEPAVEPLPEDFEDDPGTQGGESPRSRTRGLIGAVTID